MKRILFTLLFFCVAAGLFSCRKSTDLNIKQFDDQEMQNYISGNGLTGMQRDLSAGDTTGIYYKILSAGTGSAVDFPDKVAIVFTVRSFDGQFIAADTIVNHVYNYVGHLTSNNLPQGVQLALINILKKKGTRARVLIPSHLGYGSSGFGTGSSDANNRVKGNQGLDYYINLINTDKVTDPVSGKQVSGQDVYDDAVCKNYIAANNLTGYTKTTSGLYYKILQAGSGASITNTSTVSVQYTGYLLNGFMTGDQYNNDTGVGISTELSSEVKAGFVEGLQLVTPGAKLSLIMPSRMAYGTISAANGTIPVNSCMRYEMNVLSID
ncbi:FKBP-type peptidyl-prolyl cis-trans isomerase [Mucilaginibacter mali]|uniref:peptidylprolyl isomerase n=1 Tax=Mucilaginibacter mali TaxID=2740462 RepID=A0A7D4Q288_9SPHI|nr:FKBP-type peptidyl-prolyl cis-trans isomerase [Mucilaginibacter mali]QKJ31126.1 FKBP-type peptidyl-prolyl cis-trans isomerase [Mucilaginibacter mali]